VCAGVLHCLLTLVAVQAGAETVVIDGVDRYRVMDPLYGEAVDPDKDVQEVVARIKDEVRPGQPVVVWHAFTNAECDVVCGFDDKKQFLGRGSYVGNQDQYAAADEMRTAKCLDICPALGAIFIGEKTGGFDPRQAELSALVEAIRHARSPKDRLLNEADNGEVPWRLREGLACYDWWVNSFGANPQKVPDAGDRYCLGMYRSTHRAASQFMIEIAPKYPNAEAHFERAAEYFAGEADALDQCHDKLFRGWEGWQEPDPEKSARAVALLTSARQRYAQAIDEIKKGLQAIDPEPAARAQRRALVRRENGKVWIEGLNLYSSVRGGT